MKIRIKRVSSPIVTYKDRAEPKDQDSAEEQVSSTGKKSQAKVVRLIIGLVILVSLVAVISSFAVNAYLSGLSPVDVEVTNLLPNSATIVWVSQNEHEGMAIASVSELGTRQLGEPKEKQIIGYDDRDYANAQLQASREFADEIKDSANPENGIEGDLEVVDMGDYKVHHITFNDLQPSTTYNFLVGNGYLFRGSDVSSFTTKAVQDDFEMPTPAYGLVLTSDQEAPARDAFMKLYMKDGDGQVRSNVISTPLTSNGSWYLDLSNLYSSEGKRFFERITEFEYANMVEVQTVVTGDGDFEREISVLNDAPASDFVLDLDVKIGGALQNLYGMIKTALAVDDPGPGGYDPETNENDEKEDVEDVKTPVSSATECSPGAMKHRKGGGEECLSECNNSGQWETACFPITDHTAQEPEPNVSANSSPSDGTPDPTADPVYIDPEFLEDHPYNTEVQQRGDACRVDQEGFCGAKNWKCLEGIETEDCWRLCINGYWAPGNGCERGFTDDMVGQLNEDAGMPYGAKGICCFDSKTNNGSYQGFTQDSPSSCVQGELIAYTTSDDDSGCTASWNQARAQSIRNREDSPFDELEVEIASGTTGSICCVNRDSGIGVPVTGGVSGTCMTMGMAEDSSGAACRAKPSGSFPYPSFEWESVIGDMTGDNSSSSDIGVVCCQHGDSKPYPWEVGKSGEGQNDSCPLTAKEVNMQECISSASKIEAREVVPLDETINKTCPEGEELTRVNNGTVTTHVCQPTQTRMCEDAYARENGGTCEPECGGKCPGGCVEYNSFSTNMVYYSCDEGTDFCNNRCTDDQVCKFGVFKQDLGNAKASTIAWECVGKDEDRSFFCNQDNVPDNSYCKLSVCENACREHFDDGFECVGRENALFAYYQCVGEFSPPKDVRYHSMDICLERCPKRLTEVLLDLYDPKCEERENRSSSESVSMSDPRCSQENYLCRPYNPSNGAGSIVELGNYCTYTPKSTRSEVIEPDQGISFLDNVVKILSPTVNAQESENTPELNSPKMYYLPETGTFMFSVSGTYSVGLDGEQFEVIVPDTGQNLLFIDSDKNGVYDPEIDVNLGEFGPKIDFYRVSDAIQYEFSPGFNLVSFNFVSDSQLPTGSDFLKYLNDRTGDAFYSLSTFENGTWNSVGVRDGIPYGIDNFQIVPGKGYLVKSKGYVRVEFSGSIVDSPIPINMQGGWNLNSIHGSEQTYTAKSWIQSIDGTTTLDVDNISKWNSTKGSYEGLQMSPDSSGQQQAYGFDFPILEQNAYFVRVVSGSDTWTPQ